MLRLSVSSIAVPAFVAAQGLDPTSQMGPLLSDKQLYRVNGYTEELIKAANDSPYGLGASIWSKNLTQVHRMIILKPICSGLECKFYSQHPVQEVTV